MKLNRIEIEKALLKMQKEKNRKPLDSGDENVFTSQQIELMRDRIMFHIFCYVSDLEQEQEDITTLIDEIIKTVFGVIDDESSICVETFACIKAFGIERKLT